MIASVAQQDGLAGRIRALFPAGVAVAVANAHEVALDASFHVKHPALSGALPLRQREYAAGRRAAERAQTMLGLEPRPVASGADRAPLWPSGLCGSITHARGICVAAVASSRRFMTLGIDIEVDAPLPDGVGTIVINDAEAARLRAMNDADRMETVVFSVKEAVYKAQYPVTRQVIGFDAVDVTLNEQEGRFDAMFLREVGPIVSGASITGRYLRRQGLIACAVALARNFG